MRNKISRVLDDYENYRRFCDMVNEKPLGILKNFYGHEKDMLFKYGYVKNGNDYFNLRLN